MPRFISTPQYPDLHVIGTAGGPQVNPVARMSIGGGLAAYETLFAYADAERQPMAAVYGGTYGPYAMAAGKAR